MPAGLRGVVIRLSDLFEYYLDQLDDCQNLAEVDALMFEAADDANLSGAEFIRLTAFAKVIIDTHHFLDNANPLCLDDL